VTSAMSASNGNGGSRSEPVSYEQVAAVCKGLLDGGEKVSVRRVQAEVGGSNTTVLNHLRRWQELQRAALAVGPDDGLLSSDVRAALGIWAQALADEARAEAEARIAELEELYGAAKDGWESAEARIDALEGEVAELRADKAKAERAHGEQVATLDARAAAAQKQVGDLEHKLAVEQKAAEASRAVAIEAKIKADAAERGAQVLTDDNKAMREELRALQKAAANAEQRAAVAEERAQNRDEGLAELRRAVEALRKTSDELGGRLNAAEKARGDAERELAVARSERVALEKALTAATRAPHASQNAQPQEKQS
jgi:chromosome segregation ATPase